MSKFSVCKCGHSWVKHSNNSEVVKGIRKIILAPFDYICRVKNCKCKIFNKQVSVQADSQEGQGV